MEIVRTLLSALIFITLIVSVSYSFRSRRAQEPKLRGLFTARMNIAMGLMLVVIAITQLFFFNDSNIRRVFGTICVLLGLFNLFAGIRNHNLFNRMP